MGGTGFGGMGDVRKGADAAATGTGGTRGATGISTRVFARGGSAISTVLRSGFGVRGAE